MFALTNSLCPPSPHRVVQLFYPVICLTLGPLICINKTVEVYVRIFMVRKFYLITRDGGVMMFSHGICVYLCVFVTMFDQTN